MQNIQHMLEDVESIKAKLQTLQEQVKREVEQVKQVFWKLMKNATRFYAEQNHNSHTDSIKLRFAGTRASRPLTR